MGSLRQPSKAVQKQIHIGKKARKYYDQSSIESAVESKCRHRKLTHRHKKKRKFIKLGADKDAWKINISELARKVRIKYKTTVNSKSGNILFI